MKTIIGTILKVLAFALLSIGGVIAILVLAFDMRLEMTGARWGGMPTFVFHDRQEQWQRIEAHREAQSSTHISAANSILPADTEAKPAATPSDVTTRDAEKTAPADDTAPVKNATTIGEVALGGESSSGAWPSYRGPAMDGVWPHAVSVDWPDGPQVLYKQPLGVGYASFVGGAGLAFTIEQRRGDEVVAAYEPRTGAERWTYSWPALFKEPTGDGPRATPVFAAGRVVALGALGDLVSLDADTGSEFWRTNILEDARAGNATWGMAGSPLVVDGLVVVQPGGDGASVVAYDFDSGDVRWRSLSDRAGYTAPMVATLSSMRQLLVVTATRAVGLSIGRGELLWEYPWETTFDVNAAQPILLGEDRVFISAGYDHGAAAFRVGKRGDGFHAEELWLRNTMKNQFSSSVLWQGNIYGFDNGILACIDIETGERRWKGGRYGHGQLLRTADALLVVTEKGSLAVVELTPTEFRERSQHKLLRGKTWNVPAIVDGVLLVRNATEMAAIDLQPGA